MPAKVGTAGIRAKRACKRQFGKYETSVSAFLAGLTIVEREACETAIAPCCGSFRNCRAGDAYTCIFEALQGRQEVRQAQLRSGRGQKPLWGLQHHVRSQRDVLLR